MANNSRSNCSSLQTVWSFGFESSTHFNQVWSNLDIDPFFDGIDGRHPIEFLPFQRIDENPQFALSNEIQIDTQRPLRSFTESSLNGPQGHYGDPQGSQVGPEGSTPSQDGSKHPLVSTTVDQNNVTKFVQKSVETESNFDFQGFEIIVCDPQAKRQKATNNSMIKSTLRCKIVSLETSMKRSCTALRLTENSMPPGIYLENHQVILLDDNDEFYLSFWADEKSNDLTNADIVRYFRVTFDF